MCSIKHLFSHHPPLQIHSLGLAILLSLVLIFLSSPLLVTFLDVITPNSLRVLTTSLQPRATLLTCTPVLEPALAHTRHTCLVTIQTPSYSSFLYPFFTLVPPLSSFSFSYCLGFRSEILWSQAGQNSYTQFWWDPYPKQHNQKKKTTNNYHTNEKVEYLIGVFICVKPFS